MLGKSIIRSAKLHKQDRQDESGRSSELTVGGGADSLWGGSQKYIGFIYSAKADSVRNEIHYRTHLLPFTRCDRGATQQIPIMQSLAHLVWTPDSILNFAICPDSLHFCGIQR